MDLVTNPKALATFVLENMSTTKALACITLSGKLKATISEDDYVANSIYADVLDEAARDNGSISVVIGVNGADYYVYVSTENYESGLRLDADISKLCDWVLIMFDIPLTPDMKPPVPHNFKLFDLVYCVPDDTKKPSSRYPSIGSIYETCGKIVAIGKIRCTVVFPASGQRVSLSPNSLISHTDYVEERNDLPVVELDDPFLSCINTNKFYMSKNMLKSIDGKLFLYLTYKLKKVVKNV
jgi:hypothetical protein